MRLPRGIIRLATWNWDRPRVALPAERSLQQLSRRRRALQALFAGAVVYLVLHLGLAGIAAWSRWLRDPVYADKERKWQKLVAQAPPSAPRIVFLGTSRVANGFAADEAERRLREVTGRAAVVFNWGLPASGPVTQYLHFRRLMSRGERIDLLLLEVFPALVTEADGLPVEAHFTDAIPWDSSEWPLLERYHFPVTSWQHERRSLWIAPWWSLRWRLMGRLAPSWLPYHQRYDWSRGPDPRGWSPILELDPSPEQRAKRLERARQEYEQRLRNWRVSPPAERAVRDLLHLARQHRVTVLMIWMPEGPSFQRHYSPASRQKMGQWLEQLAAEAEVRVVDCRDWMAEEDFSDGHHLLPAGAVRWTRRIAQEVLANMVRE
jgi:hypothetical protein